MKMYSSSEFAIVSHKMRYCIQFLVLSLLILPTISVFASDANVSSRKSEVMVSPITSGSVLQMLLGLTLVIALIVGLTWLLRKMQHWNPQVNGALKVLAVLSMGARERVVLLQVGEQQILVGVAPGRVQAIHVLEIPINIGHDVSQSQDQFADRLKSLLRRGGQ